MVSIVHVLYALAPLLHSAQFKNNINICLQRGMFKEAKFKVTVKKTFLYFWRVGRLILIKVPKVFNTQQLFCYLHWKCNHPASGDK